MNRLFRSGLTLALLSSVCMAAEGGSGGGDGGTGAMSIEGALRQLNHDDDRDWTGGGLPSISRVAELIGRTPSRQEITDAKAGFQRTSTDQAGATKSAGPSSSGAPAGDGSDLGGMSPAEAREELNRVGAGNPMDAANNGERDIATAAATGGPAVFEPDADLPSIEEIVKFCEDPILLMEAAVQCGMNGRYSRNSTLKTLLIGYQSAQAEIKSTQARVDQRLGERARAAKEAADYANEQAAKSQVPDR